MTLDDAGDCRNLYIDLLKRTLTNTIYGDLNISPTAATSEYSVDLRETGRDWPAIAHTMIGLKRLNNLQECVERVLANAVAGDLIETGVWRGGASIFMRGVLKAYGDRQRTVWVADSFEGLPEPDAEAYPADAGDTHHRYSELAVSLEDVMDNFRRYDLLDEQVRFVKGWFRDTLPGLSAQQFALIRLDGDMYESTMIALESLYPKLAPGGFVVVDDYGAIEGCRRAIDDFRDANAIFDPMLEADWTGVYWQKTDGQSSARDLGAQVSCGTIDAIDFFDERTSSAAANIVTIPRGLCATVRGWAVDESRAMPAGRVLLQIDGGPPTRAVYGLDRPDVARALRNSAFNASGFRGTISTADLLPGRHTLCAIAIATNGSRLPLTVDCLDFVVEDGLENHVRGAAAKQHGDVVIDEVRVDGLSQKFFIRGWAADRVRSASASNVFAVVGSRIIPGVAGLERSDVAIALGNDAFLHSGYEIAVPIADTSSGEKMITIRAFTSEGTCLEASRFLNADETTP